MPDAAGLIEVEVGPPAHGGGCVARHEGRVVFVRHALPGERVRARITEDRGGSYCRADAVEILTASPDRVAPPCPYAGPGRCGGCDWQHASGAAQRAMKAHVIREQFRRVAGLDVGELLPAVEELPGGLLGWRTRVTYAVDGAGRAGLHRHRSTEIEHVERCLLGAPGVGDAAALGERWPGFIAVEAARGDDGEVAVLGHRPGPGRRPRGRRPPDRVALVSGPEVLHHEVRGRSFRVSPGGFWQVHPAAAATFAQALLDALRPMPGDRVLELYSGAGSLTAVLAQAVGARGAVIGIEGSAAAVQDAAANLADLPWATVRHGRVTAATVGDAIAAPDLVVLDPPRAGAGRDVMSAICALRPRFVGYVSCDPATLARDVALAAEGGWRLHRLRAFDAFPMTQHVECVAALAPDNTLTRP
ncbi:MAG TPA: TRAM domain-containing protein [Jatrophihabitans sp.]|nr:TRAM domain-containing protein [Jatrophihabitans sp.]